MSEENPFEDETIALQWINSVEGEKGMVRDNETYPALSDWFEKTSKGTVIDIGSGQGVCSSKISGFSRYIGVEPSFHLNMRANELFGSLATEFLIGNAYALPIENNSCDNAFSVNVWFHLENLDLASRELARVLKSNGKFFIHTANGDCVDVWRGFYINPSIDGRKIIGEVQLPINNMSRHICYLHNNSDVIASLQRAGLIVSRILKIGRIGDFHEVFCVFEGSKI